LCTNGRDYKTLCGMLKANTSLSINTRRRHDNIKMNLKEKMSEGVGWTHLAPDRDRWRTVRTGPSGSTHGGEFLELLKKDTVP